MDNPLTVFIFTDKAQKALREIQFSVRFDTILLFACVAFLLYLIFVQLRKDKSAVKSAIVGGIVFLFILSGWRDVIRMQQDLKNEYTELTNIYLNNDYKVVEGPVNVVHREPEGGHDTGDIITINGVEFEFSCFSDTFGYNKTIEFKFKNAYW